MSALDEGPRRINQFQFAVGKRKKCHNVSPPDRLWEKIILTDVPLCHIVSGDEARARDQTWQLSSLQLGPWLFFHILDGREEGNANIYQ